MKNLRNSGERQTWNGVRPLMSVKIEINNNKKASCHVEITGNKSYLKLIILTQKQNKTKKTGPKHTYPMRRAMDQAVRPALVTLVASAPRDSR